jgi:Mn-dependent DtxR family transcriptional regulator
MAEQQKEWLTVEQVAKELNVHPETISENIFEMDY